MNQALQTPFRKKPLWAAALCALAMAGCGGCSGTSKPRVTRPLPFETAQSRLDVSRQWKESFPGPITDLALAAKTGDVLASNIPDPDVGGKHMLTLLNRKGKKLFEIQMKTPVKSLAISRDGAWMVVNHHEGMLIAYDREGKILWEEKGNCRPMMVEATDQVLCYHDDDTRPEIAFEVFTRAGKPVTRFPLKGDALSLKLSADAKWVAMAVTGGKAMIVDTKDYKVAREFKVKGEILDVSVSQGDLPRIAILSVDKADGQTLSAYGLSGASLGTARPTQHAEQAEILPGGKLIALYGNSQRGQYLAMYSATDLSSVWQKQDPRYADYSLSVQAGEDRILAGFEEVSSSTRVSKLLVLDLDGKLKADIPLETAEGSYLYNFAYSAESSLVAIATDDKVLQLYELK